ncbi:hypothetical protein B0H16DRAFT_1476790 [Mycena metata]|uniref:Uncharacterized protein n=1 Tax=Mycena metata TaxID=1033252 RepID=A0AAD7HB00_9AGAR|nr:hypothetical protein B0H16DRAFT_1476790 [Mycena metata]
MDTPQDDDDWTTAWTNALQRYLKDPGARKDDEEDRLSDDLIPAGESRSWDDLTWQTGDPEQELQRRRSTLNRFEIEFTPHMRVFQVEREWSSARYIHDVMAGREEMGPGMRETGDYHDYLLNRRHTFTPEEQRENDRMWADRRKVRIEHHKRALKRKAAACAAADKRRFAGACPASPESSSLSASIGINSGKSSSSSASYFSGLSGVEECFLSTLRQDVPVMVMVQKEDGRKFPIGLGSLLGKAKYGKVAGSTPAQGKDRRVEGSRLSARPAGSANTRCTAADRPEGAELEGGAGLDGARPSGVGGEAWRSQQPMWRRLSWAAEGSQSGRGGMWHELKRAGGTGDLGGGGGRCGEGLGMREPKGGAIGARARKPERVRAGRSAARIGACWRHERRRWWWRAMVIGRQEEERAAERVRKGNGEARAERLRARTTALATPASVSDTETVLQYTTSDIPV